MNKNILIADIETTGFLPAGKIVEIGIVELCLCCGSKQIIYNKVFNPALPIEELEKTWIVQKGYMNTAEILLGAKIEDEIPVIQKIINDHPEGITAYNKRFDLDFLEKYGLDFFKTLTCPMLAATDLCKIPKANGHSGYKWPNVEECYKFLFPESDYIELHRGADDAMHEAEIVFKLNQLGRI